MGHEDFRRVEAIIREVLLHDWDPIGVPHTPQAQDEYDSYIGRVYSLLASRASVSEVADYLGMIERDWMGLTPEPVRLIAVARKLCEINIVASGRSA